MVILYLFFITVFICQRIHYNKNMPRIILHLDLDAFFCSVEEIKNPALAGKPFAVGGKPNERGACKTCSAVQSRGGLPILNLFA